jgi:anti-anti-sigma regulatory factor
MNVTIHWEDDAKTVVRYTYSGNWNWDDFYRILEWRDEDLLHAEKFSVIVDFRDVTRFPSDAVLHLKRAATMVNEKHEQIILITNSSSLATLFNMFIKLYSRVGQRLRLVTRVEEAYAMLKLPSESL